MPTPLIDFESNFRSAETLLKVYRLLETPDGPQTEHALMQRVREMLMAREDEELILLINELFLGVVRENADVRQAVFKRDNLCMLLRQAIVAACSAIDVYYPALLRAHLPKVIAVKQRNFLPMDRNIRDFMKDFSLSVDQSLRLICEPKPEQVLGDLIFEHLKRKTLSTSQGVAVSLQLLGIDEPWGAIAGRLGTTKEPLIKQFDGLVTRRNDIVHRGDRDSKDPAGDVQDIAFAWAANHVQVARNVVQATDELVQGAVNALTGSAPADSDA